MNVIFTLSIICTMLAGIVVLVVINNGRLRIKSDRLKKSYCAMLEAEQKLIKRINWYRNRQNDLRDKIDRSLDRIDELKKKDQQIRAENFNIRAENFELKSKLQQYEK